MVRAWVGYLGAVKVELLAAGAEQPAQSGLSVFVKVCRKRSDNIYRVLKFRYF